MVMLYTQSEAFRGILRYRDICSIANDILCRGAGNCLNFEYIIRVPFKDIFDIFWCPLILVGSIENAILNNPPSIRFLEKLLAANEILK